MHNMVRSTKRKLWRERERYITGCGIKKSEGERDSSCLEWEIDRDHTKRESRERWEVESERWEVESEQRKGDSRETELREVERLRCDR